MFRETNWLHQKYRLGQSSELYMSPECLFVTLICLEQQKHNSRPLLKGTLNYFHPISILTASHYNIQTPYYQNEDKDNTDKMWYGLIS